MCKLSRHPHHSPSPRSPHRLPSPASLHELLDSLGPNSRKWPGRRPPSCRWRARPRRPAYMLSWGPTCGCVPGFGERLPVGIRPPGLLRLTCPSRTEGQATGQLQAARRGVRLGRRGAGPVAAVAARAHLARHSRSLLQASQDEIRQQFRKLALAHHPDRAGGSSERFQRIVDAFEVLRDPQRRASYDTSLVQLLDMQVSRGGLCEWVLGAGAEACLPRRVVASSACTAATRFPHPSPPLPHRPHRSISTASASCAARCRA